MKTRYAYYKNDAYFSYKKYQFTYSLIIMNNQILAQMGMRNDFASAVILYLFVSIIIFFIGLYIFRAVFNIPTFLRYQRTQIRLLEEMAKTQGVDNTKVQSIISENMGWEGTPTQSTPTNSTAQ